MESLMSQWWMASLLALAWVPATAETAAFVWLPTGPRGGWLDTGYLLLSVNVILTDPYKSPSNWSVKNKNKQKT